MNEINEELLKAEATYSFLNEVHVDNYEFDQSTGTDSTGCDENEDNWNHNNVNDFKPLNLVWAKFHERNWFPAIVIDSSNVKSNLEKIDLKMNSMFSKKILKSKDKHIRDNLVYVFGYKNPWYWTSELKLKEFETSEKKEFLEPKDLKAKKKIQSAYNEALEVSVKLKRVHIEDLLKTIGDS